MFERLPLIPALRARWRTALLVWLAILAAVVGATLVLPPRYEASAALVVEPGGADPIRGRDLVRSPGEVSTFMATQVDVMRSEAVARGALQRLGLDKHSYWQDRWQRKTGGQGDFEAWLAGELLRKLSVWAARDSNVVHVRFTSPDARFSAAVANAFVASYLAMSLQMRARPASQFNRFFEERAHALRQTLEAAKARLSAYERKHGLIVAETAQEPDVEAKRLADLTAQLVALQDEATAAANRQRQARSAASRMREVRNDPEVRDLGAALVKEEGALAKLKIDFGENHPAVREAHKAIDELRGRLDAAKAHAAAMLDVPVKANEARLAEVRREIERQRARVLERRAQRNAAGALLRDVESAQKSYDAVLQRASQTALEAANTTQPDISIVKSATPPALAASLLLVNLLVAMVLGPLLGTAAALWRELRDRRLRGFEDVPRLLEQPLLLILPDGAARHPRGVRRALEMQRRLAAAHPQLLATR